MYVKNKDETAVKVTYYNYNTNKTHEYNMVKNGNEWNNVV